MDDLSLGGNRDRGYEITLPILDETSLSFHYRPRKIGGVTQFRMLKEDGVPVAEMVLDSQDEGLFAFDRSGAALQVLPFNKSHLIHCVRDGSFVSFYYGVERVGQWSFEDALAPLFLQIVPKAGDFFIEGLHMNWRQAKMSNLMDVNRAKRNGLFWEGSDAQFHSGRVHLLKPFGGDFDFWARSARRELSLGKEFQVLLLLEGSPWGRLTFKALSGGLEAWLFVDGEVVSKKNFEHPTMDFVISRKSEQLICYVNGENMTGEKLEIPPGSVSLELGKMEEEKGSWAEVIWRDSSK
jgi:hypothetical protein